MMIKSGATGNLIEPRVGDVVVMPHNQQEVEFSSQNDIDVTLIMCKPELPILIHRPFMVGDECEVIYKHGVIVTQPIENQRAVDAWNAEPNEAQLRHANPDWRDAE